MTTQRSGTFFGFILGLVTGLAIAAAVAFFLLRSSPVTKKEEPKPEQPVQQPQVVSQSGQTPPADPNQPMYRDTSQRPANERPEAAPAPASAPASTVNRPAAAPETRSPAVDPRALPPQKTSHEVSKSPQDQPVFLQAGAFKNREQADDMRGNLALLGYSSQIQQSGSGTDRFYRVRLGPYQPSSIAKIQSRLKSNGFTTTVIR